MAVIYLKHPIHGAKVAIDATEADNDAQNGWVIFDPSEVAAPEAVEPQIEASAEVVNELQPRRRGRPPRTTA
jgi:hypothetical protein